LVLALGISSGSGPMTDLELGLMCISRGNVSM
jgi:hypothetical protein